ncbi:MAG: hypothetical protein ABH884_01625 [Candidatus Komeilibacteria bacterium]
MCRIIARLGSLGASKDGAVFGMAVSFRLIPPNSVLAGLGSPVQNISMSMNVRKMTGKEYRDIQTMLVNQEASS